MRILLAVIGTAGIVCVATASHYFADREGVQLREAAMIVAMQSNAAWRNLEYFSYIGDDIFFVGLIPIILWGLSWYDHIPCDV